MAMLTDEEWLAQQNAALEGGESAQSDEEWLAQQNAALEGGESAQSDEEWLALQNAALEGGESAQSDEEWLAQQNAALEAGESAQSDEEWLAQQNAALEAGNEDIGVFERVKLEKEAQLGKKLGTVEAIAAHTPVVRHLPEMEAARQESVEQRLYEMQVDNSLEMVKLAKSIGIEDDKIQEIVDEADSGKRTIGGFKRAANVPLMKERFRALVEPRMVERIKARQEARERLKNAKELGTWGEIGKGALQMAAPLAELTNPLTIATEAGASVVKRTGRMGHNIYTLDENGKPVIAKDENGNELRGERGEWASVKALAGAAADAAVWVTPVVGKIVKTPLKLIANKTPGLNAALAGAAKGSIKALEKAQAKLETSAAGRLLLKTHDALGKLDDKVHFGSLPNMMAKSRVSEFLDNVVGLGATPEEREKFGEWVERITSAEDNLNLFLGMVGAWGVTAAATGGKAQLDIRRFRKGAIEKGGKGREAIVGEFIGEDAAKKLSNEDLDYMARVISSKGLTVEKVDELMESIRTDKAETAARIDSGQTPDEVLAAWRAGRGDTSAIEGAMGALKGELEERRTITPEMEQALDERIALYSDGQESVARAIKEDFRKNLTDNKVFDDADQLDEMVAMSARKFEPETRRLKIHDLRGSAMTEGEKVVGIKDLGIETVEDAEREGLVSRDQYGRLTGGATEALKIVVHGTERLRGEVAEQKISGRLAGEIVDFAEMQMGSRERVERTELIDSLIDCAQGDEQAARAIMAKFAEDDARGTVAERISRATLAVKEEGLKARHPDADGETVRGAMVEPVETADGRMTTLAETMDVKSVGENGAPRAPQGALEGVEQAARTKATKLEFTADGAFRCAAFPELAVRVSSAGVELNGFTPQGIADPAKAAEVAAVLAQATAIARRNGVKIVVDEVHKPVVEALIGEIKREGLAKTQAKLDTRAKLFSLLFKTTLGNGVTYDEVSFRKALEEASNGRRFIDNHGDIYGLVDGNNVLHFNPGVINFNTPIHEYGHLALDTIKVINRKLWQQGMDLIKDSEYYRDIERQSNDAASPYAYMKGRSDDICDEALATLIGDRGEKLVLDKGLEARLKEWLKEVWKAFKGAFGLGDLSDKQVEKMTLDEFVNVINAELLSGREFGAKKKAPVMKRSVKRYDESDGSGSNGLLRWRNDRGYLFAIPVDMERTQPGGKVVFATDDADITDYIQRALNGIELRLSKSGKIYVKGQNGLPAELAEIFGKYPTIGQNDGIREELHAALGNGAYANATVEQLVDALKADRANYDEWVKAQDKGKSLEDQRQETHYADEAAREEAEARERWENSGMGVLDYIRSRVEEGVPEFDLDWEIAREMARDFEEGRFAIGGIYTGSAADYANRSRQGGVDDGPSLVKIGSGEGAQVYGWGLYGSTVRSVAEGYAKDARKYNAEKNGKRIDLIFPNNMLEAETAKRLMENGGDVRKTIEKLKRQGIGSAIIKELEEHGSEYSVAKHEHLYEQTFFTDRAPGDESHLLKWYEPVSEEQKQWILKEAFSETAGFEAPFHSQRVIEERFAREDLNLKGEDVYVLIEHELGSPKAASEFLARAGIDGVKYPVDSYAKTVKDGDAVGWNYVSFRDDNIRVDHKWTDGEARFAVGGVRPSKLGDGKQRYYEVPFNKAVDKIVKAKKPIGDEHVFISETPEVFAKIGFPRLPIMMTQRHVLSISSDANTLKALKISGNAHDMKNVLKQVPKALQKPLMIIASQTKPDVGVVAITRLVDKDGRSVIVPVAVSGLSRIGGGAQIDAHIMTSAYGKDNAWSKLVVDAIEAETQGKIGVFYIDNTRASMIQNQLARASKNQKSGTSGLQLPSGSFASDFVHSITDPGSPVNTAGMVDQTASRQFKEWFGKSKVVNRAGQPQVVYHGTPNGKFWTFDKNRVGETWGADETGFFFTSSKGLAEDYTKPYFKESSADPNLFSVYLSIQNPLVIDRAWWQKNFGRSDIHKHDAVEIWDTEQRTILDAMREGGHDGVIIDPNPMAGEPKMYMVPEPTQIKSATDNIGTFDKGNPDIRFQTGGRNDWKDIDLDIFEFRTGMETTAMGETEQSAAGLAGAREQREALRPWTKPQSPADLAKPIAFDAADLILFWRAVSGSLRNPHVQKGERIAGRKSAIGLNIGGDRIEIVSRLFGVIDEGDRKKLHDECRADGFFRNEDADWCAVRGKSTIAEEEERSRAELARRTAELYKRRVETGEGGEHYAAEVLAHEIGHTLGALPTAAKLGPVGEAARTLYEAMTQELERKTGGTRKVGEAAKTIKSEVENLIAWWHGQEQMPEYYAKDKEMFAELFGIFLTQPESVQAMAPRAYDTCVKLIAGNEKLAAAYKKMSELKWSGAANDRVMAEVRKTWDAAAQRQYRELNKMTKESISLKRDWFNFALNDRFGPMFAITRRSLAAEKKRLQEAVKSGAMSEQEAADRIKAKEDEINALKTSLYNWQRQSGGQTRLMIAGFDDVRAQAEREGVSWSDVRDFAHNMRVIELGGRATAHGITPARAAVILEEMKKRLGSAAYSNVEKTWKAFRAVYERSVLDDPNVRELFDADTMKMLEANKHYVTMRHRMGVEEAADWEQKIKEYRAKNSDAWDPCIDIQERLNKGLGATAGEGSAFVLHHLVGSFEATEDPIAATIRRAIEIKESAARNHLIKQTSETLRMMGAKGVYDKVAGSKPAKVDPNVYGKLTYMDGGEKHELIVPRVVYQSFKADPMSFGAFGAAMRTIRNTMTLWNPMFVNRAYLIDRAGLETNIKGLHKAPIDILSEAFSIRGVGVPLYMVNNYLARFTPICNTWLGKLLWNENTVNHYAHRAQKIASIVYEGRFAERIEEARRLRELGETGKAQEIEENLAIAQEMLRRNVFQSAYSFNKQQAGFDTDEIMRQFGYRIEGGTNAKTWRAKLIEGGKTTGRWWTRYGEEQEAVTKIIAYLYEMKKGAAADAAARTTIEMGGTPNLAARGVWASYVENATGFFWNVRKEATLRTLRAIKDHPTEWIVKNFAQTAVPAVLKGLMICGGLEKLIRYLFDDDEEKIQQSWWAAPVINHARFMNEAMKCVPGYYQRNYNVIPLAKFGDHVLSMRVKYSPEEFAIQNLVHTMFQKFGADPTDPDADFTTLNKELLGMFSPDVFGRNYALDLAGVLIGPMVGFNPYDSYRQRNVYDQTTWEARWSAPGNMATEIIKNFWNYSPLASFTTTFKNNQERKLEDSDVPAWLDAVLSMLIISRLPASMLSITSGESYLRALERVDKRERAYARLKAADVLEECIKRERLGGFQEGLKELSPELQRLAIRHVVNGWRQYHMDPRAENLRKARNIKDPKLRIKAQQWIEESMRYGD